MEPLDLRTHPPRPPKDRIDGVTFLPRTIDKARASLPGGNLGEYRVGPHGFSPMMFDMLGVSEAAFIQAVAEAPSEAAFLLWWREHANAERYAEWNARIERFEPGDGDRKLANQRYPWYEGHADYATQLDLLEEDDRRLFA